MRSLTKSGRVWKGREYSSGWETVPKRWGAGRVKRRIITRVAQSVVLNATTVSSSGFQLKKYRGMLISLQRRGGPGSGGDDPDRPVG